MLHKYHIDGIADLSDFPYFCNSKQTKRICSGRNRLLKIKIN